MNTILKDIIDSIKIGYDFANDKISKISKFKNTNSISRGAKSGTLQFQTITTDSISLKEGIMISKALERNYVSFIRILTSLNSVTSAKNVQDYLSNLHQNLDLYESYQGGNLESVEYGLAYKLDKMHDMHKQFKSLYEGKMLIEHKDLPLLERNSYFKQLKEMVEGKCVKTNKGVFELNEDGTASEIFLLEDSDRNMSVYKSMPIDVNFRFMSESITVTENKMKHNLLKENKEFISPFKETCLNELTSPTKLGIRYNNSVSKLNGATKDNGDIQFADNPTTINKVSKDGGLLDNDAKKANELVPTMLRLVTHFQNKEGKIIRTEEYIIGVKAELHPVNTASIVENLVKGIKKNNTFFNFVKLTTGEISFFKDFVFALNDIKDDVDSKFRDNSWWSALKRRKQYAKVFSRLGIKDYKPNSTIVVSIDEINLIKQQYKLDFSDKNVVKKLMNNYFLLGFVICDPSTETCKFLFDGDRDFVTYSYASLERENSNKTKEISNIMQILGKM